MVVLEKDLCYRSTSAMLSAGGIRQQFSVPENIKMSMYGAEFLKNPQQLAVDGEIPDLQFHENGYLFLTGDKSKHVMLENYQTQRECGADWMKLLNKEQMAHKFPWLHLGECEGSSALVLGSYGEKNEGYFDPWLFVNALKRKNISMGVKYVEGHVSAPPT
ncbi:FAD-binding oxidoreductase, partial [archaeon]